MRRVLAVMVGASAAVSLLGGVAFAAKNPPVQLEGKVTNKGEKSVKKGKISIEADDYYFKPTFEKAKLGSTVTVKLENEGKTQHTFTIPSLGIDEVLNPGKKATVNVTLPTDGALGFYCRFHGAPPSGGQGMQGAFFSKKGETVTTGGSAAATGASTATTTASTSASTSSSGGRSGY